MPATFLTIWLVIAVAAPQNAPERPAITVSAAVSLTDALPAAAEAYGRTGGGTVRFNFAASNVLARQIANGAPVDLFISADDEQMNVVEKAGAIAAGSRVDLGGNRLAGVA